MGLHQGMPVAASHALIVSQQYDIITFIILDQKTGKNFPIAIFAIVDWQVSNLLFQM